MGHPQTHRSRLRASGVHPTPEAPASRTVGSAAPASPMCHIAPWMRLPLAPPFCAHPRRCGGRSRGIALRAEKRGKAPACAWSWKDAVSATRRFESSRPSHPETVGKCGFLAFADFADKAAIAYGTGTRQALTFEETRAHLSVETQHQWSDKAILRTTPALLSLFSSSRFRDI